MEYDKTPNNDDTRMTETSFPIILRPLKEKQNESNKSLFKNDSQSSQLRHRPEIVRRASNSNQIRKFMRKVDQFNTLNYQQLKPQRHFAQFPQQDRSSVSLYKLGRDISQENTQQIDKQKQVKRIYMGKPVITKKVQNKKKINKFMPKHQTILIDQQIQTEKSPKNILKKNSHKKSLFNSIHNSQKLQSLSQIKEDNDEQGLPRKKTNRRMMKIPKNEQLELKSSHYDTLGMVNRKSHEFNQQMRKYSLNRYQQKQLQTIFYNSRTADMRPMLPLGDGLTATNEVKANNIKKTTHNLGKEPFIPKNKPKFSPQQSNISQKILKTQQAKSANEMLSILAQKSQNTYDCTPQENQNIFKLTQNPTAIISNKQQISIQVPQISELKVGNESHRSHMGTIKATHPIRNDFNEKDTSWILDRYKPKSDLMRNVNLYNFQIKKYKNGVYFGELNQQGSKHGKGVIFYFNGRTYEGQFHNDVKQQKGYQVFPDGSTYKGEFKNGVKNGKGVFEWHNGQIFDGQWQAGKKSGSGMWKSPTGDSYIGQWKNGKVEGFGVFVVANGDRYEGEFKNSLKHGLGTQRYHNGETYVGSYNKNRPNGEGQYYWSNGNYYKGTFSNGLRHGYGLLKETKNNTVYKGEYRNDKKCGYGQIQYSDEKIYVGNFENDLRHGYGELYKGKRCLFKGYWLNDKQVDEQFATIPQDQMDRHGSIPKLNSKRKTNKRSPKTRVLSKSPKIQASKEPYKRACGCNRKH